MGRREKTAPNRGMWEIVSFEQKKVRRAKQFVEEEEELCRPPSSNGC